MSVSSAASFARPSVRASAAAATLALVALAVGRVHFRVQTTLAGYEIGRLKSEEAT